MSLPSEVIQVVRRVFGARTEVLDVEFPGPWAVARLHLSGTDGPASVVAKWLRSNPEGWRTDPRQMLTEVVGLRFAEELAPELVPGVVAAEFDAIAGGVVLLEDLSPREPLDDVIRREGVAASADARRGYARALGRLGAATASHDQDFQKQLDEAVPDNVHSHPALHVFGPPWENMRQTLRGFGVRIPAAADAEAAQLRALFAEPGPFLALSNGDMATNNFLISAKDDGRLIDFEFAHFGHALAPAANFFVPGPPWIVINDPIAEQLDLEFRAALVEGVPQAADDKLYENGIAAACVAMAFERCGNLMKMDSRSPGDPSRVQRVATVEAAAAAAEARRRWAALTDLLRELARVLRNRWPDADVDQSSLAPYTPRRAGE